MSEIDPARLAAQVKALHGYELDREGAARAAPALVAIARAVAVLAAEPQFYEEPAGLAATLTALAPGDPEDL
jgi:hypothetical protein